MANPAEGAHLPIEFEDEPLITALPPVMDYVTYMVLLETQLVPEKLSILNKLLIEDDGTLVQEIGWDLLRLVLPMLQQNPQEATKCLECIARRGNPREVIVKVAEELERLGDEGDPSDEDEDNEAELPTFAGEAERIHLGSMTLDGMPSNTRLPKPERADAEPAYDPKLSVGSRAFVTSLQFQSLMSMLSILHLRIKTQYPSRFLATSLPAALAAYRRIGVTEVTTYAFLSLLEKLSGKQPQLPPRAAAVSADSATTTARATQSIVQSPGKASISLPDSEAESGSTIMQQASENERTIVLRLLQAVLLEALDDYMSSLQAHDPSNMAWTTRIRERNEPLRLVPGRKTETQKWLDDVLLSERDEVLKRFLDMSKGLSINVYERFREIIQRDLSTSDDKEAESPSEYPTKPSQIPFPPSGVLFLYAAQQFAFATSTPSQRTSLEGESNALPTLARIYHFFRSPDNTSYLHATFATEDALLLLFYLIKDQPLPTTPEFDFKTFFLSLATFCAEFPDPQLRDSAHRIATVLFHGCPDIRTKIGLAKEILGHSTSPAALKAVVLGWIKDELLPTGSITSGGTMKGNLSASDLTSDHEIASLLFPVPTFSSSRAAIEENTPQLPYYIASLNLISVVRSSPSLSQSCQAYDLAMETTISASMAWRKEVATLEKENGEDTEVGDLLRLSMVDLLALDDALVRVER